jgi:hypothetical protein
LYHRRYCHNTKVFLPNWWSSSAHPIWHNVQIRKLVFSFWSSYMINEKVGRKCKYTIILTSAFEPRLQYPLLSRLYQAAQIEQMSIWSQEMTSSAFIVDHFYNSTFSCWGETLYVAIKCFNNFKSKSYFAPAGEIFLVAINRGRCRISIKNQLLDCSNLSDLNSLTNHILNKKVNNSTYIFT